MRGGIEMTKDEMKDEMKDKISMALKDPVLQQGFEIICQNLAELEKENAELKAKNCWKTCEYAEPKSQWISQHIQDIERLTKAKELLAKWIELFKPKRGNIPPTPVQVETEQFLNEARAMEGQND